RGGSSLTDTAHSLYATTYSSRVSVRNAPDYTVRIRCTPLRATQRGRRTCGCRRLWRMARIGGYAKALVSHPCTCSEGRRTPLRGAEVGNRRAHQKLPGLGDRETTHQNRHVDRTGCDDRQPPSQT